MSELIDRQKVIDRLKKAEDVFRQNGAKLEANGIHYAMELVESDIEIPTIEPRKERPKGDLISREDLKKAFEDTVCIEPMPYAFVKQIIDNAPTVIPEKFKPLIDKVVDILPELTSAIIEQLPQIISSTIKCSECPYYKDTWMDGGANDDK